MPDSTARLSSISRLCIPTPSGLLENYLSLILPDREYYPRVPWTMIKARFIEKMLGENGRLKKTAQEIVEEVMDIAKQGTMSHLVLYGRNRIQVLAGIICCKRIPPTLPIVLSEREMEKGALIGQRIGNVLSPAILRSLPDVLDFPENVAVSIPGRVLEKIYASGRLIQPYQIDTERYPFSMKYI